MTFLGSSSRISPQWIEIIIVPSQQEGVINNSSINPLVNNFKINLICIDDSIVSKTKLDDVLTTQTLPNNLGLMSFGTIVGMLFSECVSVNMNESFWEYFVDVDDRFEKYYLTHGT